MAMMGRLSGDQAKLFYEFDLDRRMPPDHLLRKIDAVLDLDGYERSRTEREKVEMLFAHLKHHLGFERLRLRGLSGAQDEFLLAATAQNLRRLAKLANRPSTLGHS